jgi:2'-5' RNA ligase
MRCFVAVTLDEGARAAVAAELERLRPLSRAVAWVPAANLHLTLRFLGERPESDVPALVAALEAAARATPPFRLALHGMGGFPGLERPRILWVGVADGALEARTLQARLESELEARGFGREARPWHPHLTVGRVFDQQRWRREARLPLREAVARLGTRHLAMVPVDGVALVESNLSASGAHYREVARVMLGAAGGARLE